MLQKPKVLRSINAPNENRCVDLFQRSDHSFGFEEYRRDPEDNRGWFAIGGHADQHFNRLEDADQAARDQIMWFEGCLESGESK